MICSICTSLGGKTKHCDMVDKLGCDSRKLVVSGNPRFDLYRADYRAIFSDKAEKIRKLYGPFILVTTNFAFFNNYIGPDAAMARMRARRHAQVVKFGRGVLESRLPFQAKQILPNLYRW